MAISADLGLGTAVERLPTVLNTLCSSNGFVFVCLFLCWCVCVLFAVAKVVCLLARAEGGVAILMAKRNPSPIY